MELLKTPLHQIAGENFNYVLLYFERILSEYTLNRDLWTLFIDYTDEMCKNKEAKIHIYQKAVKNCPQLHEFWLGYMREMEKNPDDFDSEKIQQTAIQAIELAGEQVTTEFQFEILKSLCEYYVRQLIVPPNNEKLDIENNQAVA